MTLTNNAVPASIVVGLASHRIAQYMRLTAARMASKYANSTMPIYYLRAVDDSFVVTIVPETRVFAIWECSYEQFKLRWQGETWNHGGEPFPDVVRYSTPFVGDAIMTELANFYPELLATVKVADAPVAVPKQVPYQSMLVRSVTLGNSEHPIAQHMALVARRVPMGEVEDGTVLYYVRGNNDRFVVTIDTVRGEFAIWPCGFEEFKRLFKDRQANQPAVCKFDAKNKWMGNDILARLRVTPELLG